MITVQLSLDEMQAGAIHGVNRYINALREGRGDKNCTGRHSWDDDIEAALAELAWCKDRGVYWTGLTQYRAKDGGGMEVRWAREEGKGGLISYDRDGDVGYLLLVDGYAPKKNIIGYLSGVECKEKGKWQDVGKGYYLTSRDFVTPYKGGKIIVDR
jgi:hypothetical protein